MNTWMKRLFRILLISGLDVVCLTCSGAVAFWIRFDFSASGIPRDFLQLWWTFLPIQILITLLLFLVSGMYNYVWRAVGSLDALVMGAIVLTAFLVNMKIANSLGFQLPMGVYFIMLFCEAVSMVGIRCALRFWTILQHIWGRSNAKERILLIGAGSAGRMLLQEINFSKHVNGKVRCVVDDDPEKQGNYLGNIPIIGGRDHILSAVKRYGITQIIFSIPSATPQEQKKILDICKLTDCRLRILPGLYQMINGEVNLTAVKDVAVEDLLGRAPVQLDNNALNAFLSDKVVLVTGTGSIGSELCRQIALYRPRTLILLDIYENNAYDIQQELLSLYHGDLDLRVEIASIREKQKIYELFAKYRPQVIFHAAAHKHVPLMESCPEEAIKNNIFGTYHVVRAAERYGAEKFVMISTDKAVNPTNFMGATKRFCEMIIQSRSSSATEFCAVRFGNVLGSNGSVVPLFKKQIAAGGPITLTDKRVVRYFMTIPEAAQLVLQAGAMAEQGQIFVLDMGEPVKILNLAENLIRLSGLRPYVDVEIKEVGLRPGEKLYEELLMKSEHLSKTENAKIFIEQQTPIDPDQIMDDLVQLDTALARGDSGEQLISLMRQMIATYHDPEEVNRKALEEMDAAQAASAQAEAAQPQPAPNERKRPRPGVALA